MTVRVTPASAATRLIVAGWKRAASTIAWVMSRICSRRSDARIRRRGSVCAAGIRDNLQLVTYSMTTTLHFPALAERVRSQRGRLPSLYGDVDFSAQPYRLALDPDDESSLPRWVADRGELLDDERAVELMSTATMLGALDRYGRGFEAAAMVRLMHSMVRYNALKKTGKWDLDVYGIPIPQVDQMPAGLISVYFLARRVEAAGRSEFNARERAVVEFARYRCFLLGLPEELLPTTPA